MSPNQLKVGGLIYRSAGWRDWADVVVKYLFSIMYKFGISVQKMEDWLSKLSTKFKGAYGSKDIPDEVVKFVADALANVDIPSGEFIQYLTKRLYEDPPPGFRKQKDDLGNVYIKRQRGGPKSTERPLHRGAKFRDKVFVGVWWHTDSPRSGNHAKLRNLLKRAGGGIFHKVASSAGVTEYFGYAIVPSDRVVNLGIDLLQKAEDLEMEEGDRDYRLSASKLDSLAENKPVSASDTFTAPRLFKSQKFNWELNLPDLLNGRSKDSTLNKKVQQLLKSYKA